WDKVAEAGKLISQINISTEGLLLQGKRIQLDGDVTMTTAFALFYLPLLFFILPFSLTMQHIH
ncbi:mannitol-1-phosphate 5-dehydrogenase, partial [Carnobacterium sp. AT7]|uniref:hypothetical protein n=1 Tax=Carnobacterium sp. AT7 TaxID=333990 RepID=UPI00015F2C0F